MKEFPTADQVIDELVLPEIRETVEGGSMPTLGQRLQDIIDDDNWDEDSLEEMAHDENYAIDSQEMR